MTTFQQVLILLAGFILLMVAGIAINRRMVRRIRREDAEATEAVKAAAEQEQEVQPSTAWMTLHLLPALDGLDDAVAAASVGPQAQQLVPFVVGLNIVQSQFFKALGACGVEPITVERGALFDPEVHAAVELVVSEDQEPGTVASVLRRGYRLSNGRLLRPASVLVTKRDDSKASSTISSIGAVVGLLCAVLLCGCFEVSSVTGYLLGRWYYGSKSATSDAGETPPDAGTSTVPAPEAEPITR